MTQRKNEQIRQVVRDTYGEIARKGTIGCGGATSCCGGDSSVQHETTPGLGYRPNELSQVAEAATMSLGCGNPQLSASLQPGETVLDLGSGRGLDCFLAARAVGAHGRVIGVDMTPEMIARARERADEIGAVTVEFRLGEIEHLPVADGSVDVIISNCVINLSPEKFQVLREAHRVLKAGGRLAIADTLATAPLPDAVKEDLALHAGCVAGASRIDELAAMLEAAGFTEIRIRPFDERREIPREWLPGRSPEDYIVSARIEAVKP